MTRYDVTETRTDRDEIFEVNFYVTKEYFAKECKRSHLTIWAEEQSILLQCRDKCLINRIIFITLCSLQSHFLDKNNN